MLDETTRNTYIQLKKEMDAAYKVLKQNPAVTNASRYTAATQAFTNFCLSTMATLVDLPEEEDTHELILANIEAYETCRECKERGINTTLLHRIDDSEGNPTDYIESSDFLPDFPGWCHNCLVEHCKTTNCGDCTLTSDPETCSFAEVAKLHR
jgi:hypothetical protein